MLDYSLLSEQVESWARAVGQIQKDNLGRADLKVATKSSHIDLVTEIDKSSEAFLLEKLRQYYPEHNVLTEETGTIMTGSDYRWIIDPLDGTTNYAQGLPIFAVSIALQFQGVTQIGVVFAPVLEQMFTAIKGQGAYLNGQPLKVSDKTELSQAVLATGFPYDRITHSENNVEYFAHFVPRVRGLRRMGSAAYDLANTAAGTLDGYWELNLSPWDVAAGALLVAEAGGQVVYLTEKRGVSLVAGNRIICEEILKVIR